LVRREKRFLIVIGMQRPIGRAGCKKTRVSLQELT
jgi:hypothetical protein